MSNQNDLCHLQPSQWLSGGVLIRHLVGGSVHTTLCHVLCTALSIWFRSWFWNRCTWINLYYLNFNLLLPSVSSVTLHSLKTTGVAVISNKFRNILYAISLHLHILLNYGNYIYNTIQYSVFVFIINLHNLSGGG